MPTRVFSLLMICSVLSTSAHALVFSITTWTKPVQDTQYQQWMNQAPPAFVWQNDPEIVSAYGRSAFGTTSFCEPASIGTALYNQKLYRKVAPNLSIAGVDLAAKKIDTNQTLHDLVNRCKSDPKRGTHIDDAFRCIADIYIQSGYKDAEIKLIANEDFNYAVPYHFQGETEMKPAIPYFTLNRRKPTLQDIVEGLKAGYEVIAISTRIAIKDGQWKKVGGHWFNVSGYGMRASDAGMDIFATDPTAYAKYGRDEATTFTGQHPLYYTISATPMTSDASIVPEEYAPVRFRGLMIEKLTPDVVLGELLLLKAQR